MSFGILPSTVLLVLFVNQYFYQNTREIMFNLLLLLQIWLTPYSLHLPMSTALHMVVKYSELMKKMKSTSIHFYLTFAV